MVRVMYIGGFPRSGTTLFNRVLAAHDGYLAVGELRELWVQQRDGVALCSCGEPCGACEFWQDVLSEVRSGGEIDLEEIISLRYSVPRMRNLPLLLFPRLRSRAFQRQLDAYLSITERLYAAIQRVSGCEVIVDSSKHPIYGLVLAQSSALDVSYVHMTRDSRACVFSWRRLKRQATVGERAVYLPQSSVWQTAALWNLHNVILAAIAGQFRSSTSVRYEDFVRRPTAVAGDVIERLEHGRPAASWTGSQDALILPPHHLFAGNPNRMDAAVRIRVDDEWRAHMPVRQRRLVSSISLPMLWKYGYLNAGKSDREIPAEQLVEEPTA